MFLRSGSGGEDSPGTAEKAPKSGGDVAPMPPKPRGSGDIPRCREKRCEKSADIPKNSGGTGKRSRRDRKRVPAASESPFETPTALRKAFRNTPSGAPERAAEILAKETTIFKDPCEKRTSLLDAALPMFPLPETPWRRETSFDLGIFRTIRIAGNPLGKRNRADRSGLRRCPACPQPMSAPRR